MLLSGSVPVSESPLSIKITPTVLSTPPTPLSPQNTSLRTSMSKHMPADTTDRVTHSLRSGEEEPQLFDKLPLELVSMVMNALLHVDQPRSRSEETLRKQDVRFLSRASLVCRRWSRILRPILFADLLLRSTTDVRFLMEMLRRQKDEELSAAIIRLSLCIEDGSLERCWRIFTARLPSLRYLHCRTIGRKSSNVLRPLHRSSLVRHTTIRKLSLCKVQALSFTVLSRLIGELEQLEELECSDLVWVNKPDPNRPPALVAPFKALRVLQIDNTEVHWAFLWLFSTMFSRRCIPISAEDPLGNRDTQVMISLVKDFDGSGIYVEYYKDQLLVTVTKGGFSYPTVQAQLWKLHTSFPYDSALKRLGLYDPGGAQILSYPTADCARTITQKAVNLEFIAIQLGYDLKGNDPEALKSKFSGSELHKLNKISVYQYTQGIERECVYERDDGSPGIPLSCLEEYESQYWQDERMLHVPLLDEPHHKMPFCIYVSDHPPFTAYVDVLHPVGDRYVPIGVGKAAQCVAAAVEHWLIENPTELRWKSLYIDSLAQIGGVLQIFLTERPMVGDTTTLQCFIGRSRTKFNVDAEVARYIGPARVGASCPTIRAAIHSCRSQYLPEASPNALDPLPFMTPYTGSNLEPIRWVYCFFEGGQRGIRLSSIAKYQRLKWTGERRIRVATRGGSLRPKMTFRLCLERHGLFTMQKRVLCQRSGQHIPITVGQAAECATRVVQLWFDRGGGRNLLLPGQDLCLDALLEIRGSLQILLGYRPSRTS